MFSRIGLLLAMVASIAPVAGTAQTTEAGPATGTAAATAPCVSPEIEAAPMRPNWSTSAQTTQCGVFEVDSGWLRQDMGGGTVQHTQVSSLRYGLSPRIDLRWAAPGPILQPGGNGPTVHGISDEWFNVRYRFWEQRRWSPAMAFSYGYKDPSANPAKSFGSGYADHTLLLIASRDLGRAHFDFNAAGLIAGGAPGKDGSVRFGLVMSLAVTKRFDWMLESDGGSQPGIPDRFGEALTGASWMVNPRLVLDAAYTRAYTAGTPRQQITVGCTVAIPKKMVIPAARSRVLRRWMGR